jgi:hypothetical protein
MSGKYTFNQKVEDLLKILSEAPTVAPEAPPAPAKPAPGPSRPGAPTPKPKRPGAPRPGLNPQPRATQKNKHLNAALSIRGIK